MMSLIGISSLALYQSARAIGLVDGNWWSGMWQNFATEMIGAIMTFTLFEILINANNQQELLVRQMASHDQRIALSAVAELRALGYLFDGTLHRKSFADTHLEGINLRDSSLVKANFQNANLQNASLINADLRGTNLQNASLIGADLMGVRCNQQTRLPDGRFWSDDVNWSDYTEHNADTLATHKRPQSHYYRRLRTKQR